MATPRKSARHNFELLSMSDEEEVANKFYSSCNLKSSVANKDNDTANIKNKSSIVGLTRSLRKSNKNFEESEVQNELEEDLSDQPSQSLSLKSADLEKPSALFEESNAIEATMFGFQTPKRKYSMFAKATDCVSKTPKSIVSTHTTPSSGGRLRKTPKNENRPRPTPESASRLGKTPSTSSVRTPKVENVPCTYMVTRSQMKNKISREADRQKSHLVESDSDHQFTDSETESSSDDDDFVPLDEEESDKDVPEVDHHEQDEVANDTTSGRKRKSRYNNSNFVFTSDDYFERHNVKSITSEHNLSKLKNPKLHHDEMMALLKDTNPKHKNVLKELDSENQCMFKRWLVAMSQGFNVLLYGIGSKRTLLNTFYAKYLSSCPTLVVNGYFPGITIKDILDTLATSLLNMKNASLQPHEMLETIANKLRSPKISDVFILLHNLDGNMLRFEKIQAVLASLAALPKIHLIASIDHINSPLLWDQNKLSQFNFIWEDATSFLPYFEETSFESSLMVQRSGTIALTALRSVFQSLNINARKVFCLLMEHQLNSCTKSYQGMLFAELYRACRNSFIVSSDLALRTQLTEFFDHKLVKHKKDTDHLIIPVDRAVLRQFNEEMNIEE